MNGKMIKYKAVLVIFLCFIFQFAISCVTTGNKNAISDADIELLSWSFDRSGISHADYSLFTLNDAAAARNPRLNDFLNTVLYKEQTLSFSGQTAQEYLDNVKKASADWNLEWYEENFTYEIRGKYLLLKRNCSSGVGSSYEKVLSYIIDTALVKRLAIDDIITDSANPGLQELIWSRLSQTDNFSWIAAGRASINQSLEERSFSIFFEDSNVVFHWDKASMAANAAGAFEASLARSEILPYLTETGREILN